MRRPDSSRATERWLTLAFCLSAGCASGSPDRIAAISAPGITSPVKQVDHVMFTGGAELSGLVTVLRDKFELPVVFDGPAQTPPSPGIGVGFGNVTLEVVSMAPRPGEAPRSARLGSLALQARDFPTTVDALRARQIDHFPPDSQTRWTTIGLRGFGGGMCFIDYRHDMDERRERFRRVLESRTGGVLGVVRIVELSQVRRMLPKFVPRGSASWESRAPETSMCGPSAMVPRFGWWPRATPGQTVS